MNLPEWSPELEEDLRNAYHNSKPEGSPSHHTGLKAVYDRLRELSREEIGAGINLVIPEAIVMPIPGLPGFSKVEVKRNASLPYSAVGLNFFARDEWIKEQ